MTPYGSPRTACRLGLLAHFTYSILDQRTRRRKKPCLEIMLAVAFRKQLTPSQLTAVFVAATIFRAGDHALAHIRLAVSGLVCLAEPVDLPNRLAMAETLLAKGVMPADLLKELGYGRLSDQFKRYNADQPRIPAGNGNESGRWTDGATSQTATTSASRSLNEDCGRPAASGSHRPCRP